MTGRSNKVSSTSRSAYAYEGEESAYETNNNYRRRPTNRSPYSRSPSPASRRRRRSSSSDDRRRFSSAKDNRRSRRPSSGSVIVMLFLPVATTENDINNFFAGYQIRLKSVELTKNYDDLTVHVFVDLGSIEVCRQFLLQTAGGVVTFAQCRIKVVTEDYYEDQVYMGGYHLYETPELPSALRSDSLARHLIDNPPCNVLIFKSLDYSATEDQVRESVTNLTPDPLYDVRVIKDKATGLSRGFCFVEMGTVADATKLLNIVLHKSPPYTVGNRRVLSGYARMSSYSSNGLGSLLPSTADSFVMEKSMHTSRVANNAIAAAQLVAGQSASNNNLTSINNIESSTSMTYDPQSGFYFDSNSGFYYDPKSGYYYDPKTSTYLYYDQTASKWVSLPSTTTTTSTSTSTSTLIDSSVNNNNTKLPLSDSIATTIKDKAKEGVDKTTITSVNVSSDNQINADADMNDPKKIAKEMEKWAKKQKVLKKPKQTITNTNTITNNPSESGSLASAFQSRSAFQSVQLAGDNNVNLSAQADVNDNPFIVCDKLLCLLCVRRFKSRRHLQNHVRLSQLHRENLLLFNARAIVSLNQPINGDNLT